MNALTLALGVGLAVSLITVAYLLIRLTHDVSRVTEALAQSQERLNLTLRSAKVALWSWEIDSNVITADERSSVLFGLPLGQFPATVEGFGALLHPDDRDRVQRQLGASVAALSEYETEFRAVWPDRTVRHLAVRGKVYGGADKRPQRLIGVCWDVTERREAEQNLRATNEQLTRSLKELERGTEQSVVLGEMAELLQACSASEQAYEIVARFCAHFFPRCAGALYIFSASRNLVNSVVTWNDPIVNDVAFDPDDCWALRRGHPHVIEPGQFATPCRHLKDSESDGHACFPLMAQGMGLGIVYLQDRQRTDADRTQRLFLSAADQRLAITVAEQVALSLSNLQLQEALRLQSIRDPLTGLFNRRYLEESVEREIHRMARRSQPVGLVMIDLDHFKRFNDSFGHDGGDALLRAFGQFLRERLRHEDIACRYGGEEFCLLFGESSLEDTVRRTDQLRAEVKGLAVQLGGRPLGLITLSAGVASYPIHGDSASDLIAAADDALYQAKAGGRDRVVAAASKQLLDQYAGASAETS